MSFLAEFTCGGLLAAVAFFVSRFTVGKIRLRTIRWLFSCIIFVAFWMVTLILGLFLGAILADQSHSQFSAAYTMRRVGEAQVGYLMTLVWLAWHSRVGKGKNHSRSVTRTTHVGQEEWFLRGDRDAVGPFSKNQLMGLLKAGSIHAHTSIRRQGDRDWTPLADRLGLVKRGVPLPLTKRQTTRNDIRGHRPVHPELKVFKSRNIGSVEPGTKSWGDANSSIQKDGAAATQNGSRGP